MEIKELAPITSMQWAALPARIRNKLERYLSDIAFSDMEHRVEGEWVSKNWRGLRLLLTDDIYLDAPWRCFGWGRTSTNELHEWCHSCGHPDIAALVTPEIEKKSPLAAKNTA